jgi:hypothetical protein
MGLQKKELGRLKPLNEDKGNSYLNLFHACIMLAMAIISIYW